MNNHEALACSLCILAALCSSLLARISRRILESQRHRLTTLPSPPSSFLNFSRTESDNQVKESRQRHGVAFCTLQRLQRPRSQIFSPYRPMQGPAHQELGLDQSLLILHFGEMTSVTTGQYLFAFLVIWCSI